MRQLPVKHIGFGRGNDELHHMPCWELLRHCGSLGRVRRLRSRRVLVGGRERLFPVLLGVICRDRWIVVLSRMCSRYLLKRLRGIELRKLHDRPVSAIDGLDKLPELFCRLLRDERGDMCNLRPGFLLWCFCEHLYPMRSWNSVC